MVPIVRLVELSDLFLPDLFSVKECLQWRSAATLFPLMCPFDVVMFHPDIQIGLQFLQRVIQFPPEGNLVKLVQDGLVETFADAVCLRMSCLGLGMLYAVYAQIKLVVMRFQSAAVLCAPVRQHADNAHFH